MRVLMIGLIVPAGSVTVALPGAEAPAAAQGTDPGTGNDVLARARPGLDPVGIPVAGLRVFPRIDGGVGYDDNVYDSGIRHSDSMVHTVEPRLTATSDWSRHALDLNAAGRFERYSQTKTEDKDLYMVTGAGRFDAGDGVRLNVDGHVGQSAEARGSAGDIFTAGEPVRYRTRGAGARLVLAGNRLGVRLGADVDRLVYRDVRIGTARVSQAYRDRTATGIAARIDLNVQPRTALFVEGIYGRQRYDTDIGGGGTLDSDGLTLLGGVRFDLGRLITGWIGAGYLMRDYRDPALRSVRGPTYDVSVVWNPRTLLTVTLAARKAIAETPTVRSSGFISNAGSVTIDYEVLRRVIAQARTTYTVEKYRGIDRTDHRTESRIGLRYLMNRFVEVGLQYDRRHQNGSGAEGRSYTGNAARLTVTLQR